MRACEGGQSQALVELSHDQNHYPTRAMGLVGTGAHAFAPSVPAFLPMCVLRSGCSVEIPFKLCDPGTSEYITFLRNAVRRTASAPICS